MFGGWLGLPGKDDFLEWLRSVEGKWQAEWRKRRVFEPSVDPGRPKYFITIPYPYTNGPLHIGHGRTYTIGDIVARFKRMRGFNVLFPMAFHITGTPIIAVSERIARGDREVIERYRKYVSLYVDDPGEIDKIVDSFKDPLNLAVFFAERIHRDFDALGYSIDWRRRFHTGEKIYNAFVTWQYLRLREKGLITRGEHIVTYCLLHKQPEGEDDIQDADVNPVEILEYTAVKFRLKDDPSTSLVAATLRPETIFGVTNLWVHPDAEYVIVEWRGEKIIISSEGLVKLQHQHPGEEMRVVKKVKGRELIGKWVVSPFGRLLIVLPAFFVDPDNATGIVYSEPSDAPYDYVALEWLKKHPTIAEKYGVSRTILESIRPLKIIDVPGIEGHHAARIVEEMGITDPTDPRLAEATRIVYKEQYYKGRMIVDEPGFKDLPVKEAKEKAKKMLAEKNLAFPFYELNRKAYCRAGGKIIAAKIRDQWFLDYSVPWWKEEARRFVKEKLKIIPEKYRKAFLDTIDWLEKRPCARKRGLGTRLPFDPEWVIESLSDSTIYMAFYTIAHIIREKGITGEQLKPSVFDYVFYGKGEAEKVSGETGIPVETLREMRREFTYWYPVDQRHTGIAHISNHLSFFIFHHIALFPPQYWPRMISLNEMVIREGAKMSKSKGNVILLRDIVEKYSADLYRLYIAGAANLDSIVDWREKDVNMVKDSLRRFKTIAEKAIKAECPEIGGRIIDRWFESRFNRIIMEATRSLENMNIRGYVQEAFHNVLNILEHYRDRTSSSESICMAKRILDRWLRLLSPVIPHITEELWSMMDHDSLISLEEWPSPDETRIDPEAEALEEIITDLVEDVREVKGLMKPEPHSLTIIIASPWKFEAQEMILEGTSMRDVINTVRDKYGLRGREKEIAGFLNTIRHNRDERIKHVTPEKLRGAILEAREYIERKTGLKTTVMWEEEAKAKGIPRTSRALPTRPGIYLS
jgi:leucyl-tRNA synthetase